MWSSKAFLIALISVNVVHRTAVLSEWSSGLQIGCAIYCILFMWCFFFLLPLPILPWRNFSDVTDTPCFYVEKLMGQVFVLRKTCSQLLHFTFLLSLIFAREGWMRLYNVVNSRVGRIHSDSFIVSLLSQHCFLWRYTLQCTRGFYGDYSVIPVKGRQCILVICCYSWESVIILIQNHHFFHNLFHTFCFILSWKFVLKQQRGGKGCCIR